MNRLEYIRHSAQEIRELTKGTRPYGDGTNYVLLGDNVFDLANFQHDRMVQKKEIEVIRRDQEILELTTSYSMREMYDPIKTSVLRLQDAGHLAKSNPRK